MINKRLSYVLLNESSKETAKREPKEELNLEIEENEIYYIGSYVRKTLLMFG